MFPRAQEHKDLPSTIQCHGLRLQIHKAHHLSRICDSFWDGVCHLVCLHQRFDLVHSRLDLRTGSQDHSAMGVRTHAARYCSSPSHFHSHSGCQCSHLPPDSCSSKPHWPVCREHCRSTEKQCMRLVDREFFLYNMIVQNLYMIMLVFVLYNDTM